MTKKNLLVGVISGLGIGAGLMYIFDPSKGKRRRALACDRVVHLLTKAGDAIETASYHVGHKAKGALAEASLLFKSEEVIDDVLVARIRAKIGRVASHPHAIEVHAKDGHVTLAGSLPKGELDALIKTVSSVRGVTGVVNRLTIQEQAKEEPIKQIGLARTASN